MYDVILKNGLIMDGKGGGGYKADIAIFSSTIALITKSDISRNSSAENARFLLRISFLSSFFCVIRQPSLGMPPCA